MDEQSLTPEQSLALIERQQADVARSTGVDARLLFGAWGLAWLLGFGLVWLQASGRLDVPGLPVGVAFAALLGAAAVITAVHTGRASSGIRGDSALAGALYGWSWLLGFAAMAGVLVAARRAGASTETMALLWPATSCLLVGVLYCAGGAVWRDLVHFALGAWVLVVTTAAAFAGQPTSSLVMAVAGGGGFLVAAAVFAARAGRADAGRAAAAR